MTTSALVIDVLPESRASPATPGNPGNRAHGVLLSLLVVIGAAFRLWGLGANRLDYDESFTAMAGRRPLGSLFEYLRTHDSHPPLDYLLHAPLARAGVSEFFFRLPGVVCSIAAVVLVAWWMRRRGVVGIVATGLFALSTFQIVHGREARMYAELELIGVGAAVIADSWLRRPRAWHAPVVGAIVLVGLFTHVSMFLLGAGLLALPGLRTDRQAWRWRWALAAATAVWAALWGPSFLTQSRGGHSDWIPHTTVPNIIHTVGSLVVTSPGLHVPVAIAVGAGAYFIWRADSRLGRVWTCCVLLPACLAVVLGILAPVLLARALTVIAWGPLVALGFLVAKLFRSRPVLGALGGAALVALLVVPDIAAVTGSSVPDQVLHRVEQVARSGDVVAVHSSMRLKEVVWSVGILGDETYRAATVSGLGRTSAIELGRGSPTGRVWLLDWSAHKLHITTKQRCSPDWWHGGAHLMCLERSEPPFAVG
jgi:hypothetical protein